jgi:uncharacterized membrane protein YtjA (UPF0391 family)
LDFVANDISVITRRRGLPAAQPSGEQASNSRFPEKAGGNQFRRSKLDQRFFAGPPIPRSTLQEQAMTILKWALIFFLVSIVAGILGFTGVSAASADVARFLFYVFVVIFLVLLILGLTIFRV